MLWLTSGFLVERYRGLPSCLPGRNRRNESWLLCSMLDSDGYSTFSTPSNASTPRLYNGSLHSGSLPGPAGSATPQPSTPQMQAGLESQLSFKVAYVLIWTNSFIHSITSDHRSA